MSGMAVRSHGKSPNMCCVACCTHIFSHHVECDGTNETIFNLKIYLFVYSFGFFFWRHIKEFTICHIICIFVKTLYFFLCIIWKTSCHVFTLIGHHILGFLESLCIISVLFKDTTLVSHDFGKTARFVVFFGNLRITQVNLGKSLVNFVWVLKTTKMY